MYIPKPFIGEQTPENLLQYLQDELRAISRELSETTALELRVVYKEPIRPRNGMIVAPDGTSWNPGSGAGIYGRVNGAWVLLG